MPSFWWGHIQLAKVVNGKRRKRKKQGGAALGKRGNQSYRSPAHIVLIDTLDQLRKKNKISLKVAAGRLPPWLSIDFTQLSRIFGLERDVTYQELRHISIALGSDIVTVTRDTEEIVEARTLLPSIPTD